GMPATPPTPQVTAVAPTAPPVAPTTPTALTQMPSAVPPVAVNPMTVAPIAPNSAVVEGGNAEISTDAGSEEEVPRDTSKMRHRVSVRDEIYTQLKDESKRQGKPVVQLATEAIAAYLKQLREGTSD
ncbi:MAG: hypothetical protein ACRC2J_16595, partial [Microcoleaceae cyanobacterium]